MKYNFSLAKALYKGKWAVTSEILLQFHPVLNGEYELEFVEKEAHQPLAINASSGESASSYDEAPKGSIAIMRISGTMLKNETLCAFGTENVAEWIREAADHKNIAGLVMQIDSGGGAVDAIAPLRDAMQYMQAKGKSVVALADLAASLAYYTCIYADHIMADNDISAEFGSIGVMVSFADTRPAYEKMGVKFHTIYAPESTHKNKAFEEALKGKYELLKNESLSPLAKKFQSDVREQRQGKVNLTVDGILNGRMFYADKALEYGLIDSIGNLAEAVKLATQLSNQNK